MKFPLSVSYIHVLSENNYVYTMTLVQLQCNNYRVCNNCIKFFVLIVYYTSISTPIQLNNVYASCYYTPKLFR